MNTPTAPCVISSMDILRLQDDIAGVVHWLADALPSSAELGESALTRLAVKDLSAELSRLHIVGCEIQSRLGHYLNRD